MRKNQHSRLLQSYPKTQSPQPKWRRPHGELPKHEVRNTSPLYAAGKPTWEAKKQAGTLGQAEPWWRSRSRFVPPQASSQTA
ncbi:Hypothetical predicted protein, partial [Pelobates cultripes]